MYKEKGGRGLTLVSDSEVVVIANYHANGSVDGAWNRSCYLNQILARMEASSAGADEAVMLNSQGRIAEGTGDNIFVIKKGVLYTPPLSEGSLGGITRSTIISITHGHGIEMVESPLTPFDLYTADECFLTGTGAELIPVKEIYGRQLPIVRGTIFSRIEDEFLNVTQNYRTEEQLVVC